MTRRQRLMSRVALCGLATVAFLPPASARSLAAGRGFVGHPFTGHVSRPIFSNGIRHAARRAFGFRRFPPLAYPGFPWLTGYDDQGPYYYFYGYPAASPDENAPAAPVVETGAPNQLMPIVAYRPGCRTTTQTVPAEAGGTSKVNVTRCY